MDFSKMSKFQLLMITGLGMAAFFGLGLFAVYRPSSGVTSTITIWGTMPAVQVNKVIQNDNVTALLKTNHVAVTYAEHPDATIDQDLLQAMALGVGPDALMLSQDQTLQYQNRIVPIPYTTLPLRDFKDNYIQEAGLFLTPNGVTALPFMVDPMVMYWNRDMLTNASIVFPPKNWSTLYTMIPKINKVDLSHNISRSTVAFGSYDNVSHAKDILSLLFLQSGSPIVMADPTNPTSGKYVPALSIVPGAAAGTVSNPGDLALSFYTQFADPNKTIYSWNSAQPLSRDAFVASKLALYFGFASELSDINARNPNLNYDVAPVPQPINATNLVTFGKIYGLSVLRSAKDTSATYTALSILASAPVQGLWNQVTGLPPVLNSLLATTPTDPAQVIFYKAALQSKGWLDPNRAATDSLFSSMVRDVVSGASRPSEAVGGAEATMSRYFPQ